VAKAMRISGDGVFEINGHAFQIPEHFSNREAMGYRSLLAPVPDIPGGTKLTAQQRVVTETYLHRRAAACVIPGFRMSLTESVSHAQLQSIHGWIDRYRPTLSVDCRQ